MLKLVDVGGIYLVEVERTEKGIYYRGYDSKYDFQEEQTIYV